MARGAARAAFEAWNRGDFALVPQIDDPEVETRFTGSPIGLDPVYYGPEGHCQAMEAWNEAWGKWDAEIEDVIAKGRDRILVVARVRAVGSASGITLNGWVAGGYTFRDGRIVRVDGAFDQDRARVLDALVKDRPPSVPRAG
jgi:ketosteroid isomerase-like protein